MGIEPGPSDPKLEKNVTPNGNRTRALWFQVQHYPFYTNLTFACKTETLGSLYSHALLISLSHALLIP